MTGEPRINREYIVVDNKIKTQIISSQLYVDITHIFFLILSCILLRKGGIFNDI